MDNTEITIQEAAEMDAVRGMIKKLDQYQLDLYENESCKLESLEYLQQAGAYILGAYADSKLIAMGAVKLFDGYAEIKRMYVDGAYRGLGLAKSILAELEAYAKQNGKALICLETGNLQYAALAFYKNLGYAVVEKYGNHQPNKVGVYHAKAI